MSLMGRRFGGQCPSKPLTTSDKVWLWLGFIVGLALFFGPLVLGVRWWVFG
jgi:hypothetical protein